MSLVFVLRVTGVSLIALSLFHVVLWRTLGWEREMERLSPVNARIFAVHAFFVAFVLGALGLLSLLKPQLLVRPSELARLLATTVVFWIARLVIQPVVFDRAMQSGWTRSPLLRVGMCCIWLGYVAVYGAALFQQLCATDGRWESSAFIRISLG